MRILVIYPGHSHCTFDVAAGYDKALRALGHEVWRYDYHSSLAFYQEALDYWRKRNPAFDPDPNAYLLLASEHAVIEVVDRVPDVVLVVSGTALHPRAWDLIDRLRVPIAVILTESPYADDQQAAMIERCHVALSFTNDRVSVDTLPGKVVYLPHSYDPEVHYPRPVNGDHRSDVFFHGTLWPERVELFAAIDDLPGFRHSGVSPAITCTADADAVMAQMMDNDELARWYCGTKIALNHHRTFAGLAADGRARHIRTADSLGPRAYEIAACGAFQLCDDMRTELWDVFDESVATYYDADELRSQIVYYLDPAHEAERLAMAAEARERVQGCNFQDRAREILIPALEGI